MIKQSIAMVTIGAFLSLFCSKSLAISNSYELAIDYFASDNFDAAAIELRNALKNTPMNVPARVLFGQVLLELDDPRQAVTELEKGLALGGDLNLILPTLGRAYLQLLEPQKVLTAIIPPGSDPAVDGELLLLNGDAALLLGDLNYATDSYERAHSHLPSDTRPLVGKARIALARGRQGLAMSLLDQALEAEPSSVDAWILKGMHHRDSGEKKLAREALNRALQLDPLATKALGARAALLLDLGERGDASKDIALLRDVNPHDFEGLYLQAWLLISDGERERAQLMLQEVVDALGFFTPEQRQRLPQTELLFGLVNYLSQKYAQAIEDFTTFLARFPKHDGAKRYLAFTYAATGDWDGVVTTLHPSSLSEPPSDSATLTLLAEAYRAQGNSRRAARFYENALKISPNQIQIAMALAASRFSSGEIANGISEMETLVSKRPDFKAASVELVGMYSDSGQTQKALALAQQLVDDAPEESYN
jgi:putative PEP-CTERM system TPR-repeat lipoprotein